jgi:hypothetical protein
MRRYCIDYTNSHDQSVCAEIMEPDYVVHLSGFDLLRDESYGPAVAELFGRAPGLGLVVHELILNGDRLCMRFSEHAAMPTAAGSRLACWKGIGLYKWNGTRLTENYVEQDFFAQRQQLDGATPHPLDPPHLDPWTTTEPVAADATAEAAVRAWLVAGDLTAARRHEIDDSRTGTPRPPVVDFEEVVVDDLFSAGPRVAFHVTVTGPYRGGLAGVGDENLGKRATLQIAGVADVAADGSVHELHAVTTRMGVRAQLLGGSPV